MYINLLSDFKRFLYFACYDSHFLYLVASGQCWMIKGHCLRMSLITLSLGVITRYSMYECTVYTLNIYSLKLMYLNLLNILTDKRQSPSWASTYLPFIPDWQMGQMPIVNHQCAMACCRTCIQSARGRCCICFPFISNKHQVKEVVLLPCLSCKAHGDWDTLAHLHCAEKVKVTICIFKPSCPKWHTFCAHTKTAGKDGEPVESLMYTSV